MATIKAAANGNFSATGTWTGGVVPTSADDVVSNNFTVVIDGNYTVLSLRNDTTGGATAGGGFNHTAGGFTLNTTSLVAGAANLITYNHATGTNTLNVVNNTSLTQQGAITITTGNVNLNVPQLSITTASALVGTLIKNGIGTLNIVGNIANSATAQNNNTLQLNAGTVNITGNINGSSTSGGNSVGITNAGSTLSITGNVTGGSGANNTHGMTITSGNLTVIGNVTGGTSALAQGISSSTAGSITITGTVTAGTGNVGLSSSTTTATININGNLVNTVGISAIYALKYFLTGTTISWTTQSAVGVNNILYTNDQVTGFPTAANVRFGTTYGVASALTGTLRVPSAANVLSGVLTDATTGTLLMTPADFWNYLIASGFTANSIGDRLQNASTVATTGGQIASYNI